MSNFVSMEQEIINQKLDETSTTQNFPLGKIIRANDKDTTAYGAGEFIYLKGVASTAVGEPVIYDLDAGTSTRVVAGSRGNIAIAMSANVASQFGWYQISGTAVAKTGTVASGAKPYATATAGTLDDAVVSGDAIENARFITANGTPSAGFALMQINRPSMNGNG